ncbi:MAG: 5'/3'-nucleotidase SurE [Flavobacteriaceae bacterium]|nr:5'/3'-nucleotidase SurE [Bacteroidia bacterium]NNF74490.1 5'/3'-nucleotidase SurE [Flavobacteriaceae bacterium]NNK71674.1 5'/3'-nucleotidase SurE [Flavobacteriaceae bacterium]
MPKKPLILVTNDDGITAPGIRTLIRLMNAIGDVVVVAPDSPQSGMGHAITVNTTLQVKPERVDNGPQREYSTSGTPADCVKLAKHEVLDRIPDICVSGINHGSNSSINVLYSGTMSAAIEAGIEGIPAIGFSLCDYNWDADFKPIEEHVTTIVKKVIENGLPEGIILNVNFPKLDGQPLKGIKVCRQAKANWVEEFDKRRNPQGKEYYWLTGKFVSFDDDDDTDEWALNNGYASVVPVTYDLTAKHFIEQLNSWNLND